jgi:hypothetical protein
MPVLLQRFRYGLFMYIVLVYYLGVVFQSNRPPKFHASSVLGSLRIFKSQKHGTEVNLDRNNLGLDISRVVD